MKPFFDRSLFIHQVPSAAQQFVAGLLFLLLTPLLLYFDSAGFATSFFEGRWLANIATLLYFCWLFYISASDLRRRMFTMVFVSYIGELIFSTLLGMYAYRTVYIPLYVPLGHSIVYASGYVYAHSAWAQRNKQRLNRLWPALFILIFLIPVVFLNDWFTLIFGTLFFGLLKRKKWDPLYYFIALCVFYIELLGTSFGCWRWVPEIFTVIPAANPPMGAVFLYAGGDILILKLVNLARHDEKRSAKENICIRHLSDSIRP